MPNAGTRYYSLTKSLSVATPGVRTLVVAAWAGRDGNGPWEADHEVWPVLAVQAAVVQRYQTDDDDAQAHPSSSATAGAEGWLLTDTEERHDLLVADQDYGLIPARDLANLIGHGGAVTASVSAYWPTDKDRERLSPVIGRLKAEAVKRAEARASASEGGPS